MKKYLYIIILLLILSGCSNNNANNLENSINNIDTTTVFSEIDNKNTYIIDVREDYEYASGHIKNAYNIPLSNLEEISNTAINLDSKIIVYCQSGNRSKMAANKLYDMGYTNIYDMGGITSWNYELVTE